MTPVITKILPQKKNKRRFSLMNGENFIIGVADETLIEFNIHPGMQLSEKTLARLKEKENMIAVREQAWRFLARREHSTKELKDKLLRKNYSAGTIKNIIGELTNKDYLNDARFSHQLIAEEIRLKKNGPRLIKSNLLKKGIEEILIDELIRESYSEEDQVSNCSFLARKKLISLTQLDTEKQKKRLTDFLNRKGFTWDVIGRVMSDLLNSDPIENE